MRVPVRPAPVHAPRRPESAELAAILLTNLAVVGALMLGVWLLSLRLRDASVVDSFWGAGFALVAVVSFALGDGALPRKLLLTGMAVAWGVRLSIHIAVRNHGKGEDPRYRAMRAKDPEGFPLRSLVSVFGLQGALMWVISLPLQVAQASPVPAGLTALDFAGLGLWAVGFTFEVVGDWQLARFKADPGNAGRVMDRGLWRYTRHPNYFGDAVVWWGNFTVAAAVPRGVLTVVSPIVMTWLLTRVSGVPLLEKGMASTREGYADYVRRTSAFFPWPPRPPRA